MRSVAEAMLAHTNKQGALVPGNPAACEAGIDSLDLAVGAGGGNVRLAFGFLTLAVELLPVFFLGAFSRMTRLPLGPRITYLHTLEASENGLIAMLFVALKVPLCIGAFEERALLASTGFDRPGTAARRTLPLAPVMPESQRAEPGEAAL